MATDYATPFQATNGQLTPRGAFVRHQHVAEETPTQLSKDYIEIPDFEIGSTRVLSVRPTPLDAAIELISEAGELDDRISASNAFDVWKSQLTELSEKNADSCFRQILGMALTVVRRKDVVDFNKTQLRAFVEITNILRRPALAALDVSEASRTLLAAGLKIVFSLRGDERDDPTVDADLDALLRSGSK